MMSQFMNCSGRVKGWDAVEQTIKEWICLFKDKQRRLAEYETDHYTRSCGDQFDPIDGTSNSSFSFQQSDTDAHFTWPDNHASVDGLVQPSWASIYHYYNNTSTIYNTLFDTLAGAYSLSNAHTSA